MTHPWVLQQVAAARTDELLRQARRRSAIAAARRPAPVSTPITATATATATSAGPTPVALYVVSNRTAPSRHAAVRSRAGLLLIRLGKRVAGPAGAPSLLPATPAVTGPGSRR